MRERRNYLLLMGAITAALVGAVFLAIPGSPAYKKPTLGLDLQGGLEVILQAKAPQGREITQDDAGGERWTSAFDEEDSAREAWNEEKRG